MLESPPKFRFQVQLAERDLLFAKALEEVQKGHDRINVGVQNP